MALIQPPATSEPLISYFPQQRVMVKQTWDASWTALPYLRAQTVTQSQTPTIPTARLLWLSGNIKYEDQPAFQAWQPINLKDWFVRVEALARDGSVAAHLFTGQVVAEQLDLGGGGANAGLYGNQAMTAVGLEHLLDKIPIVTGWITNDDTKAEEISHPLVFNDRMYRRGYRTIGNRSTSVCSDGDGSNSYAFSVSGTAWTVRNIIDHLVTFYGASDLNFTLGGELDVLDQIVPPRYDPSGKTVFQCLNELLDRRRGFTWSVRTSETTGEDGSVTSNDPEITIGTVSDTAVSVGGFTLPANPNVDSIELDNDTKILRCVVGQETATRYGRIIVSGERLLSCFSVSLKDNETLVSAWNTAEQNAYKSALGTNAQENDDFRAQDSNIHVFRHFRIPPTWDWKAGNGEGSGAKNTANPPVDFAGLLQVGVGEVAAIRQFDRILERQLPLVKTRATDVAQAEYLEPFAVVKHPTTSRWVYTHSHGDPNFPRGSVRMLDTDFGVEVAFQPNHGLAATDWSGAAASELQTSNMFDWRTMIVTVAARTDQRVQVIVDVEGGDPARLMHIQLSNCEMWYVVPGTVRAVSNGALVRHDGGLVRDDSARARNVAAQAKAWYSRIRSTLELTVRDFWYGNPVGSFVRTLSDSLIFEEINGLVTQKIYDFETGTTTIHCGFVELDFGHG